MVRLPAHSRPARSRPPRCNASPVAAFTLVEMLVALTIFIILATLTLGAFRGISKNDQISAASNQIKGWFEHARSKAIHDKLPRGVRFLPDANKPTLCSSVVYIGSAGYDDGDLTQPLAQRKFVVLNSTARLTLSASTQTAIEWFYLVNSQALSAATAQTHGLRCEIPRGSGYWYPIVNVVAQLTPTPQATMTLGRPVLNTAGGINEPLDYRVELGPTVLEDDDPIALPRGIVIDFDASIIPDSWRPGYNASTAKWELPVDRMDVMFTPQGTFGGQLAASIGVLHLTVSTLEDADAARLPPNPPHPEDSPAPPAVRVPPYTYPYVLANPKTTQKVVSVFMNSGRLSTSDVFVYEYNASSQPVIFDAYASGGFNSQRLDTSVAPLLPFRNALAGKEVR